MNKKRSGSKIAELAISQFQQEEARRRRLLDVALGPQDILQHAKAASLFLEEAGGASRITDQFTQSRLMYEKVGRQQFAIAESLRAFVDFPTLRIAQGEAERWAKWQSPNLDAAQTISNSVKVMAEGLKLRLAQLVPLASTLAIHKTFLATERQLREATRPLQAMVEQISRQQSEVLQMVQGPGWEQLQTTIDAVRRDFVLHAQTAHMSIAGGDISFAVTRVLDEVSADRTSDPLTIAALLGLLLAFLQHFIDATSKEVRSTGLIGAFLIIAAIKSCDPSYTADDRRIATATHQLVHRLETNLTNIADAQAQEHAYVEALPKVVITGAGRVRENPANTSKIITKLPRDTVAGMIKKQGRWRMIVYRDELTHDLAEGWIYEDSLDDL